MECQRVNIGHKHPTCLLHPFPIIEWKWEVVTIEFITKFPMTKRQHDSIVVVVDKLTKDTHFILVKLSHKETNITTNYMKDIFRLHGVPKTIVSDRDLKLLQNFGREFLKVLGQT
jgi:hypothetical protein